MDVPLAANILGTIGAVRLPAPNSLHIDLSQLPDMLVCSAHPSNRNQLSPPPHRRLTAIYDAPLGHGWCALGDL